MRPLGWGDSFGFRNIVTRAKRIAAPADLVGLKIRTIQSSIYVKTMELMGASPTPMAFGEVYTSMQTGVIDGFEHDASTTLQQRLYEVAKVMTRTRHIAGILGLWVSTDSESRLPPGLLPVIESAATGASVEQREAGLKEETAALTALRERGMAINELDTSTFVTRAEQFWDAEARALGVAPWLQVIRA